MQDNHTLARWIVLGFVLLAALLIFSLWNTTSEDTPRPQSLEEIESYLAKQQDSLAAEMLANATDSSQLINEKPQHILFIGDSMAQGLEIALKKYADFNQHKLTTFAKQSATIISWVGTDSTGRLRKTIEEVKPSYVMICLGANELMTTGLEAYQKYLENILKQASNTKLIWIGPPNWKKDNGLTDLIANTLGKGKYFSSKDLTLPRAGDGIHPTYQGYLAWADTLAMWIEQESDYKIRFAKPTVPKADSLATSPQN